MHKFTKQLLGIILFLSLTGVYNASKAQSMEIPAGYQRVENYIEHFSSSSVANSRLNAPVDPLGWGVLYGDKMVGSTERKISYTTTTSGKEGSCIGQTSTWRYADWSVTPPNYVDLYDFIITPLVKGNLKYYLKRYSTNTSYPPAVQIYRMTKNSDGTFSCDTVADRILDYKDGLNDLLPSTSLWVEQNLNVGSDFCYIGFRLQCVYLDEVGADEAIIPIKKDLSLGNPAFMEGYSYKVNSTADGKWSVGVEIPVTNTSNVDLQKDKEENYSISLVRVKSTANPYTYEVLETVSLPDLKIGETGKVSVEGTFDIPEDVTLDSSYGYYRFRIDMVENFTGRNDYKPLSSWIEVTPYMSILDIRYNKYTSANYFNETTVDPQKKINFGTFRGERTMEFKLRNRGAAPLEVISIEKPDYVTLENVPSQIAVDETAAIKVKIGGQPGVKSGEIKFITNGAAMVDVIPFEAEVVGEDEFFADFETAASFNQWYTPDSQSNWKVAEYTSTERNYSESYYSVEYNFNDKRLECTMQTPLQYIYTPKLGFKEGENFSFYAAKKTNNGNDVKLVVRYSTDRANWTELGTITVNNENPELQFPTGTASSAASGGQNILRKYSFDMPAGEYYISLGAGYVLIDNFRGGRVIDVEYDITPEKAEAGKTRIVNNPLSFSAAFKNLLDRAVAAEAQTVALYANGEKVASANAKEIGAFGTVTYDFSYTPHAAGETELYAVITIGDYSVSSAKLSVNVLEESSSVANIIGEEKTTSSNIPFRFNYSNTKSETVYTSEMLGEVEGSKIIRISYPYYNTGNDFSGDINIWMENTTDETVGATFSNTDGLTKVAEIKNFTIAKAGSSSDYAELVFELNNNSFEYTGGNLRIVVEKRGDNWNGCTFAVDNTKNCNVRYYANDSADSYELNCYGSGSLETNKMPVITLYTEKVISPVTGTVKDTEGNPVEGAKVTARSGEVIYETISDEAGEWSVTIFQTELEYTVYAKAEGYEDSETVTLNMTGSNDLVLEEIEVVVAPSNGSYSTELNEAVDGYDVEIVWDLVEEVALTRNVRSLENYTFSVELNGAVHGTTAEKSYIIRDMKEGSHEVKIYSVSPSGKMSEPLVISILLSKPNGIEIPDADEIEWRYFDLKGVEIKSGRLNPGIYVRVRGNVVEKVLIK